MSKLLLRRSLYYDPVSKELVHTGKPSYIRSYYNDSGYLFWVRKMQSRSFNHIPFPKALTPTIGFYYCVAVRSYNYADNCLTLVDSKHGKRRYVDVTDLMEIWELNQRQTNRVLNKLIALDLLRKAERMSDKVKHSVLVVNPLQFMYGEFLSYWLYELYKDVLSDKEYGLSGTVLCNMDVNLKKQKESSDETGE